MSGLAEPRRSAEEEFRRDREAFDGASYLYNNDDVRALIGFDPEGAWRHWVGSGPREDRYPSGVARAAPRRFDPDAVARPFGLNVFGPFEAISGLGTAARNLADAVAASGVPYELRPHDVEGMHARVTEAEAARPFRYGVNLVLDNADQIRRLVGLYPDGAFSDAYTIAVWAWELASFRSDFFAAFALVDEVWPNSMFELRAIAAVSPVPVHLMPLPVPAAVLPERGAARSLWGLPEAAFVVLCPFDAGSTERRKNPFAAIRAFRAAFGDDPRRILLVKHHGGDAALRARIAAATGHAANIRVIAGRLPEREMRSLRAAADAVISAHRSEGFGLNLAEFQASGRVVIATDATGSRDFLDEATGYPVRARPALVGVRTGPYCAEAVWAEPDEDALAARLREAAADPEARAGRAAAAAARMAEAFSPEAIGARMRARLEALGLHERRPASIAATAGFSTVLHVPPNPVRDGLVWPARLPKLSVIPLAATREERAAAVAALVAQSYPFWEACLVDRELPPPEDALARAALRGPDLRVRLVDPAGCASGITAAVEASAGSVVLLLPAGVTLGPGALFAVAAALDAAAPADLLTLGTAGAGAGGELPPYPEHLAAGVPLRPIVAAKALLLESLAGGDEWPELLRRMAARAVRPVHLSGRLATAAPDALPPPHPRRAPPRVPTDETAIALRFANDATLESWRAALGSGRGFDLGLAERAPGDVRRLSERLSRACAAEHVVLVGEGVPPPALGWVATVLAGLGAPENGGLVEAVAAEHRIFATTRRTLARIARLDPAPAGFREAVERLGLRVAAALAPPADAPCEDVAGDAEAPPDPRAWPELTLEAHVARVAALGLFDAEHYLDASPDVVAGGADPLRHYCEHGWREHRAPNFYFDPRWYRARHMRPEEGGVDPLLHWERHRNSGVRPSRWFDPAHVRVTGLLAPGTDPLRFFLDRRRHENVSPVPGFDPAFYRARRRDLRYRSTDPFEHYLRFGAAEGVNPAAGFDTRFYRATQMRRTDAADPVLRNPLLHYGERRGIADVVTSQNAALRLAIARLRARGEPAIGLDFAWYDGLPTGVGALRTYLADPTLAMPFRLAFANEAMVAASFDPRLLAGLRLPYDDPADDADICARLAECFGDPRCLRRDDRPVLAFVRRGGGVALERFAHRITAHLAARFAVVPALVFLP